MKTAGNNTKLTGILALCLGLASINAACAAAPGTEPNNDRGQAPAKKQGPADAVRQAPAYHWYDGDKKRGLSMAPNVTADFATSASKKNGAPVMRKQASGETDGSPVFIDAEGGRTERALPGGVLVRFDRVMTQASADNLLKPFGTQTVRSIGGGASASFWLVASEQGMPSLELANKLFESGLVKSASPNWWKQRVTK